MILGTIYLLVLPELPEARIISAVAKGHLQRARRQWWHSCKHTLKIVTHGAYIFGAHSRLCQHGNELNAQRSSTSFLGVSRSEKSNYIKIPIRS